MQLSIKNIFNKSKIEKKNQTFKHDNVRPFIYVEYFEESIAYTLKPTVTKRIYVVRGE